MYKGKKGKKKMEFIVKDVERGNEEIVLSMSKYSEGKEIKNKEKR
jgi:hypothetical protein